MSHQKILILDFGSQVTQLIARRVREQQVYCELHPFDVSDDFIREFNPKGIILERWRHTHGCGRYFNAARETVSDKFLMIYKSGEKRPTDAAIEKARKAVLGDTK